MRSNYLTIKSKLYYLSDTIQEAIIVLAGEQVPMRHISLEVANVLTRGTFNYKLSREYRIFLLHFGFQISYWVNTLELLPADGIAFGAVVLPYICNFKWI